MVGMGMGADDGADVAARGVVQALDVGGIGRTGVDGDEARGRLPTR
jgi:hypothetical protein